jgi:Domain of unknown function (DUF4396)
MCTLIAIWFILTGLSFAYVTWHNLTRNPVSWVQKLAWILVTAYTGPVGLLAYWVSCRTRKGQTHDESTNKTWQQSVNSEMHCLAGDATGIILSAIVVYHFTLPNGIDLIIEYSSAFIVGLFIFQALMMIDMFNGDYFLAVKKTFFVETVSMNMVMVGMIPVMVILMYLLPEGSNPYKLNFWFTMGMATIAGGLTAYPVNYWLVAKNLKHGCMTIQPKKTIHDHSHGSQCGAMSSDQTEQSHNHEMGSLSLTTQILWILGTFALLFIVGYLTTYIAPISFS